MVVTGGSFGVFVVNICQALLADQLESSGKATGFGELSTKKTPPQM